MWKAILKILVSNVVLNHTVPLQYVEYNYNNVDCILLHCTPFKVLMIVH